MKKQFFTFLQLDQTDKDRRFHLLLKLPMDEYDIFLELFLFILSVSFHL